MGGHEFAVDPLALAFKHSGGHVHSGFAQHFDAASAHFLERVEASYHDAGNAGVDDQFAARRSFSVVRARLKRNVDGALPQQPSVGLGDRGDCVDLGVCVAPLAVETFADDASVSHHHGAHHRVRRHASESVFCQLKRAAHICFVNIHKNLIPLYK